MSATLTQPKSTAPSKPAVPPTGSLPAEDTTPNPAPAAVTDTGTDAEQPTEDDILAALGQLSEGPKAETETPEAPAADAPAEPTEEEAPAESEEEPAAQGDAADDTPGDVDEPESPTEDTAKPKPSPAQARINELTARSKSAEEALTKANERLASYEAEQSGRFDAGALEHVDSTEALLKHRSQLVALHQKLLKSPQGIELPDPADRTKLVSHDAEQVADLLGQTFYLLHEAIPQREQYLKTRDQYNQTAETVYPWLKDSRQGPGAQVHGVIAQNPAIRRIGPNYRLVAADALIGQTLREAGVAVTPQLIAKLKAQAKDSAPPKSAVVPRRIPPAAPSSAGTVPPRSTPRANQGQAADKRLSRGNGNVNDLTASIAARL